MSAEHYCDECGKKMKRTANVNIDRVFPWQIFAKVEI